MGTKLFSEGLTRRSFLRNAGLVAAALAIPVSIRLSSSIRVWMLKPRAGIRYSNADENHMRFKFYPTREAALDRLPHRGLRFDLCAVRIPVPSDVDSRRLFGTRKDLDLRVASDRAHLVRLSIDTTDLQKELGARSAQPFI